MPDLGTSGPAEASGIGPNHTGQKTFQAPPKAEAPATIEKKVGGKANGSTRSVPTSALKASKYYPAEDVKAPRKSRKTASKAALRSSIVPGTVLILLAGRFAGKRVVYLKQLDSGLLLVSGPFKLNGVPLRRVSQAYVIATSTKVDVADVKVPETVNDAYFAKAKGAKSTKEGEFFGEGKEKKAFPEEKKAEQKVSFIGSLVEGLWGVGVHRCGHEDGGLLGIAMKIATRGGARQNVSCVRGVRELRHNHISTRGCAESCGIGRVFYMDCSI